MNEEKNEQRFYNVSIFNKASLKKLFGAFSMISGSRCLVWVCSVETSKRTWKVVAKCRIFHCFPDINSHVTENGLGKKNITK